MRANIVVNEFFSTLFGSCEGEFFISCQVAKDINLQYSRVICIYTVASLFKLFGSHLNI